MILNILKVQNPNHISILRSISSDVTVFDRDLFDLTTNMVETMFAANGVGLAAPQIGVNKNIFVMRTDAGLRDDTREHRILINPYTAIETGDMVKAVEGCLSIPGLVGPVKRFTDVGTVYWDAEGKRKGEAFTGIEARIYQHEFDHLVGSLFVDKAEALYKPKVQL